MKTPIAILTLAGISLCASCKTATQTAQTAARGTGHMAQKAVGGTVDTAAAAGRTGAGVVRNTVGGTARTVGSTARGDLKGAGRSAVNTATSTTTGAVRGTVETGRQAGSTGVNAATDAGRAAGDTVRAGAQQKPVQPNHRRPGDRTATLRYPINYECC
jgi:hypothetical protein